MTDIQFHIDNFQTMENMQNADIICVEHMDYLTEIISFCIVTATFGQSNIKIRFDWKEDNNEITAQDFLYIPETNTLFFKSQNQWGAIDLNAKTLKRHENSQWSPWIERKGNFILIEDDLKAESTTLRAETIHSVPIDPPTESKEFDDRIEYNSPVFGHQVLKTK